MARNSPFLTVGSHLTDFAFSAAMDPTNIGLKRGARLPRAKQRLIESQTTFGDGYQIVWNEQCTEMNDPAAETLFFPSRF